MSKITPAMRVGSYVKFQQPHGVVESGTVTHAIFKHWITSKPAYQVQGNCWNGVVHESQVIEWGEVGT